jgi:hypothetical protein
MGNLGSNNSPLFSKSSATKEITPAPSPGLAIHAPLVHSEISRSESVTSIHNEMNEILDMISRIILCYIKDGQKRPNNEASSAFDQQHFLKKKYA